MDLNVQHGASPLSEPHEDVVHVRMQRLGYSYAVAGTFGVSPPAKRTDGRLRDIERARENAISKTRGQIASEAVYLDGRRIRSIWAGGQWWAPVTLVPEFLWLLRAQGSVRVIVE